jgi:hypothetical protein
MIDRIIGNGNLPNVYISQIEIKDSNRIVGLEKMIKISLTLVVKDKKINGNFQWSQNGFMTDFLLINLLQSTNQNFSNQITNGDFTILKTDYKNSVFFNESQVKRISKKLKQYTDSKTQFLGLDSNGNEIYDFYYDFEIDIKQSAAVNLTYFANISIDSTDLAVQYSADFSSDIMSLYQGPVTSEIVFSGGQLQASTNKFVYSDGMQYGGAVHEHEGQYMEGPFHTNRKHRNLTVSQVPNLKVKDLRSVNQKPKLLNAQKKINNFFGDPYTTNDEDGRIKKMFFVDLNSIFRQKTKYGEMLHQIDQKVYDEALSNFKIKKLSIYRDQVIVTENNSNYAKKKEIITPVQGSRKILNITKDITAYNLSSSYNIMSSIEEVNMGSSKVRYFNFVDEDAKDRYSGNYAYTIELKIVDSSVDYLKSKFTKYKADIKALESYYLRANKRKYYNSFKKQFTNQFISDENSLYNLGTPSSFTTVPWIISVENYSELNKFLNFSTEDEDNAIKNNIFNSINPKTGNTNGILNFIQTYKDAVLAFTTKFGLNNVIQGSAFNVSPSSKPPVLKNLIEISYTDEDYTDFAITRSGYRIMPKQPTETVALGALPYESPVTNAVEVKPVFTQERIPLSGFQSRVEDEKKRFFVNNPTLNQTEKKNFKKKNLDSFTNIDKKAPKYLTPIAMSDKGSKVDLSAPSRTNSKKLNDKIKDISKRKDKTKYKRKFKKRSNRLLKNKTNVRGGKRPEKNRELSKQIKFMKPPTIKQFDLKRKLNYDAADYLGEQTKINSTTEKFQLQELDRKEKFRTDEKIKSAILKRKKKKTRNKFDMESKNNIIDNIISDDNIDTDMALQDMPLQLKALVSSRNNSSKSNLLSSQSDVLISEETENEMLITHFNIQKLEYLHGFMEDENGNPIITAPIWKEVDTDSLSSIQTPSFIMRAVNYVNESLFVDIPDEIDLPIFDSFMVFNNDTNFVPTNQQTIISPLFYTYNNNSNVVYDFCTSNIVKQSEKQNGLFTNQRQVAANVTSQVQDGNQTITTGRSGTPSGGSY